MISISRIRQLRDNNINYYQDTTKKEFAGLSSDVRSFYISLKQFECTFSSYELQELINFTGYGKE